MRAMPGDQSMKNAEPWIYRLDWKLGIIGLISMVHSANSKTRPGRPCHGLRSRLERMRVARPARPSVKQLGGCTTQRDPVFANVRSARRKRPHG
jgi:hypothetical protein